MSYRHVDAVRENAPRDLLPTARIVLLLLASRVHHRDDTVRRYPVARIAWDAGLSNSHTRRTLRELEDRALIWPIHDPRDLRRGTCQEWLVHRLEPHHRAAMKGDAIGVDPDLNPPLDGLEA